jgi:hypothetical protein
LRSWKSCEPAFAVASVPPRLAGLAALAALAGRTMRPDWSRRAINTIAPRFP